VAPASRGGMSRLALAVFLAGCAVDAGDFGAESPPVSSAERSAFDDIAWTVQATDRCLEPESVVADGRPPVTLVTRLEAPGHPFTVDSVGFTLVGDLWGCHGGLPNSARLFLSSDPQPPANPVILATAAAPDVPSTATRRVTMSVDAPFEVRAGEFVYAMTDVSHTASGDSLCVVVCEDDPVPWTGYFSMDTAAPFDWEPLVEAGLRGTQDITLEGTVSASTVELECGDGFDDDSDGLVDCADPNCDDAVRCARCVRADEDLGSGLGDPLIVSNIVAFPDVFAPSCTISSHQIAYAWTAPATGRYVFDTNSSPLYDTTLQLLDGCGDVEVACDDDSGSGYSARISRYILEGEELLIVVGGYDSTSGNVALSIELN